MEEEGGDWRKLYNEEFFFNGLYSSPNVTGEIKLQDGQCTVQRNIEAVRVTTVAVENQQVLHILSVCL
jgi:hypothetical protein